MTNQEKRRRTADEEGAQIAQIFIMDDNDDSSWTSSSASTSSSSSSSSLSSDGINSCDVAAADGVGEKMTPVALQPELVPDDIICSICMTIPLDPVIITQCEHVFCQGCIAQALDRASQCPIDRTSCRLDNDVRPLEGLGRRIWNNTQVRCGNHQHGCLWVGSISDWECHMVTCKHAVHVDSSTMKEMERIKKQLHKLRVKNEELRDINEEQEDDIAELQCAIFEKDDLLTKRLQKCNKLQKENVRLKRRSDSVESENARLAKEKMCLQQSNAKMKLELQNKPSPPLMFDEEYNYRREDAVKLSQLISAHLTEKPDGIDRNRIFNCVRSCYIDLKSNYSDNPKHYRSHMKMLIATCEASAWFSKRQRDNFSRWYREQFTCDQQE